jgi:hypothetical protein
MVSADLLGRHTHKASNVAEVHIWQRGRSYLARGYYGGVQFGETLGNNQDDAETRLHELLCEISQGRYVVPSERPKRILAQPTVKRITIRELFDKFLSEKRQTVGAKTTSDYRNRLSPVIEFSESDRSRKRWPTAADVDLDFAVEFRTLLSTRLVTRNGRLSSKPKLISPHQIYNVLDCARTAFNWGRDVRRALLPASFPNPFTEDIVGRRPAKDPLRQQVYPLERRVQLVTNMDIWQLSHLALSMLLPLRPEDCAGLLISDVDYEKNMMKFGGRFEGRDFNKGRVCYHAPYPAELKPFLRFCQAARADGPLFRSRMIFEGRRRPDHCVSDEHPPSHYIEKTLCNASPSELKTPQDQKRLIRRTIRQMGGVSERQLAREFGSAREKAGLDQIGRFYDLRAAIHTELQRAGVDPDVQQYVTGHVLSEVRHQYVSIDVTGEMEKYFATVQPQIDAMQKRAQQLGMKLLI